MNFSGCQKLKRKSSSDQEKQDLQTNQSGADGLKEKEKTMGKQSKPFTPAEFVAKVDEFLLSVDNASSRLKDVKDPYLVDLFRLWWIDFREQEALEEARDSDRRFGLDEDMFG